MLLIYLGILLLSAATLLFEITLTRVFSVAQWYHFAFMVVSLALLGFGASGSFLSLFPRLLIKKLNHILAVGAVLFSLSCLGSYFIVNSIPFDSYCVAWDSRQLLYLVIYYLSLAIPFFFTGLVLGAALSKMPAQAGKLYGFNMVGSGLGCLLVLIIPTLFGGGGTIVLAALLGLVAFFVFSVSGSKYLLGLAFAIGMGLIVLLISLPTLLEVKMSPYKSLSQVLLQAEARTLSTEWNAFSRVDVVESSGIHLAPGLSFNYQQELPHQLGLTVDGADLSPISQIEAVQADFTEYLPSALPYHLLHSPRALVIEPQGGLEVLTALHHQSSSVVAVISNPLVIEAIEGPGGQAQLLDEPRVEVAAEGIRSYLRHSDERFDVIQLSLTDSFRVVGVGAYSLSEDYHYTVKAFEDYYRHLAPGGILSVSRWIQTPPSEGIRPLLLATASLENLGITNPEQHMAAIRSFQTITLLVKESPFHQQDITTIKDFCDRLGFDVVYFPGIDPADLNRYNVLPREVYFEAFSSILLPSEREAFLAGYTYDISPPTDDRPFFFHFFKWSQFPHIWHALGKTWQPFGGAGYLIVVALLLAAVLASLIFILLPLRFRPKGRGGQSQTTIPGLRWQLFIYFLALGLGFLFIEIPLMQKFILFLDQPTYAFSIVLFTIFVFSGLGSLLSNKLAKVLPQVIFGLCLLACLYPLFLPYFFEALLGQSLLIRLLVAIGALVPLSFLMGVPFPSGIRILGTLSPDSVPWAWGINGCASVVSSILSLMVALAVGFSWVLVAAGINYLVGAAVIYHWVRKLRRRSSATGSLTNVRLTGVQTPPLQG
jgi:SAM-dependent methyltransferase